MSELSNLAKNSSADGSILMRMLRRPRVWRKKRKIARREERWEEGSRWRKKVSHLEGIALEEIERTSEYYLYDAWANLKEVESDRKKKRTAEKKRVVEKALEGRRLDLSHFPEDVEDPRLYASSKLGKLLLERFLQRFDGKYDANSGVQPLKDVLDTMTNDQAARNNSHVADAAVVVSFFLALASIAEKDTHPSSSSPWFLPSFPLCF